MCSILKILLEWHSASLTEEPLLEKCCSWVLHLTLKPDWLDAATSAFREAEALISTAGQKWASQHWANSGSEEVAVVLGACPYLPSQLQDILVLAKHSSLLQNIPEVKLFLKEEDQVKDFGWLVKYTKKWLSLKTMDMDSIATYFDPATVDKVKRFMSDVETHLSDIVSTAMKAKDDIASMVDKYRPGTGTVKLLPTGLHDSGPHLTFSV